MTLVEPGVAVTAAVTAPFESSVRAWPLASVAPPRTICLNTARVPELALGGELRLGFRAL